jgi:YVTN family beta-propeller protein
MDSTEFERSDIPLAIPYLDANQANLTQLDAMGADNTVRVLYAPRVPEATIPVVGAHAGVPLRSYDQAPLGATVKVDPYLDQQPGDTVTLDLNGQPGIDSEQTESDSSTTTLYIPKKLLLPDIINRLTYTVTRGSQNMGTSVPPLELLYNAIRPGDQDTNPGEDGHSRLELLLPDAIKNGVGPDFPAAGAQVCVSYPYCRAYDRIRLNCNGHDVFHTVTALQAPKPGSDEPVTVCFTVTRADLESAKDHPEFKFSYTVTDQLGNGPDSDSPWSAIQIIDVDLAGNRLPAPILREIQSDPTDDPGTIDLAKLGKNPLLVIVLTNDHRFLPGDTLNATYTAKVTGHPDVVVTATGVVEADDFGQKRPSVLQVANDQVVGGSVVTVTYQLLRNGIVQGSSRVATARVIGEGVPYLEVPRLLKSVNGVLDPLDAANLQGANGQVEVLGYRNGDTVQLVVEGAPGAGSPTFTPRTLNTSSRANFPLTKAFIAANLGKQVKLSYLLIRDGKPLSSSPILTASIGAIPDGHPSLPTPAIDRAQGRELDVTQLKATDQLRVSEWPHQVVGQRVWLRYDGVDANGQSVVLEDREAEPHNTLPGLIRSAPIEWLKALKHGTVLTITFRVNYDGEADATTAVTCPVRIYTVQAASSNIPIITPYDIALSPDGDRLYVTGNRAVTVIDTVTLKVMPPIAIDGHTYMIAITPDGNRAYVSDFANNRVCVVDTQYLVVLKYIPVKKWPLGLVISPDGTRAYVCCGNAVSVFDTQSFLELRSISVGDNPNPYAIAASRDGRRVYVCNYNNSTLSVIDAQSLLVIRHISVGRQPTAVAVSPNGTRVYVCNIGSDSVSVIDTQSLEVIKEIYVGLHPQNVAISLDGSRAYVSNHHGFTVSVIDTQNLVTLKPIVVEHRVFRIAISPDGTRLYATFVWDNVVSVIAIS